MNKEKKTQIIKRKITCDEIAWIMDILERLRFVSNLKYPAISRFTRMAKYSALYELMEILGLEFQDEAARYNAIPEEVRNMGKKKEYIIKHKEFPPKKTNNYFARARGRNYQSVEEIKIDLGDRFEWANPINDGLPRCEYCGHFLGDSGVTMCDCGKYKW